MKFKADFNINVNRQLVRHLYYSVWLFDNQKLKFVFKFTHFIDNIGNFVNKTD